MIGKYLAARDTDRPSRFFPLALAGCGLLVLGMVAATLVSDQQNRAASQAEAEAVRTAVSREAHTVGDRLRAFAATTPLTLPAGPYSSVSGPFEHLYLYDPLAKRPASGPADPLREQFDEILRATQAPQREGLRGTLEPAGDTLADGDMRSVIVSLRNGVHLAVVMGAGIGRDEARHPVDLIALEAIDEPVLARIARNAGTRPITIAAGDASGVRTSLDLPPSADGPGVALTWSSDRPGDTLFRTASAILAALGSLFAVTVLLLSHRMTRQLTESEARAKADAAHDLLTGLANRTAFSRNLQREVERVTSGKGGPFALVYLDIDRFKEVNDTYGHSAGDRVIITAAQRIANALRPGCNVARIGGDEFAIIMNDLREPKESAEVARRILGLFAEPIDLGDTKATVSVSIGIALCPGDAKTMDSIINSADLALYRAKNEGRNRFCFFEQRMGEELRMRKTVEDDLRNAIETNQLIMEFQPVVSLDGRRTIGVEALVRWRHPTRGTISPASFITLAEECGLILPLGEWVMRQALREARRWPDLRVAVNVSAIQFRQKDFVQTVQKLLDETGVEPSQLELELTESVLLADADQAEDAMIELRAMGVRLALDDFGTGYSSLIYLRRFAFDKIKIDKSFLESTESTGESAIIVHSIVHLGRALGLTVTAEGVETQDQHRFLQALGCHELQGFLFSAPVSASEIDRMMGQTTVELKSVA